MYGWTVSWVLADGETITSSWNGTLSQAGSLATMTNANWNNVLAPSGSTMFGFTANETSSPVVPASVSCESP
jgi:cellulase/cellobiase CelA1